jgi:UDP-2,3-diacylglucosamine hydrolase
MSKKANYTFFIADLHLSSRDEKIHKIFFNFLQNIAPKADALYILGDLFKVWAGDDDNSPFHKQVKIVLRIAAKKTPIFLLPGNRDFLLGKVFAEESGCVLLKDPTVIDLYGRKTLVTHGDKLCGKDRLYKWFRNVADKESNQRKFFMLPLVIRKFLAHGVHALSCVHKGMLPTKKLIDTVQREAISLMKEYNVDQIIHGHLHKSMLFENHIENKIMRQIVLPEWEANGMIFIYEKTGRCTIETI